MLINNIEEFASYIPTAGGYNPSEDKDTFDAFKPFIEEAELWLETQLLGNTLFALTATEETLKKLASVVIACNGYYSGIPFNDLVQTPNGFGVVSNTNIAPASSDRVNRLLTWINERLSDAIDALLSYVFMTESLNKAWKEHGLYEYYTECVFVTASSFRRYARKDSLRDDLEENHAVLMSYQHEMARMISEEYMNYLIVSRRNGTLTAEDTQMIRSVMVVVGLKFRGETQSVYPLLETMVNTMMSDLSKYPIYKSSSAYKIKTANKYQNKKNDSTFFFG